MLTTGAAKAEQRVVGCIVALAHGDMPDRLGHGFHRDLQEALGQRLGRDRPTGVGRDLGGQRGEAAAHRLDIECRVAARAEHGGKRRRLDAAEQHVDVGDRERSATPVAGRAGVGPGRVRADLQPSGGEAQHRAATRGDRVDVHHRHLQLQAGDRAVEASRVLAVVERDVGRRAAHVEADQAAPALRLGGARHADQTAGRARQERGRATKGRGSRQAAVALHELQAGARMARAQRVAELPYVAGQLRRQVGVGHGGVAARDQPDQRRDLVRSADLSEAGGTGQGSSGLFMGGIRVAVHEDDGDALDAAGAQRGEIAGELRRIERGHDPAVHVDAFRCLDDLPVERIGTLDAPREQRGPRLIADAQRVAEAGRDHQRRGRPLALEQGIGRDCGAHADRVDAVVRRAVPRQQLVDALCRGIGIATRVLREQLVGAQRPVGRTRDDVGERAAAIDPELPAALQGHARYKGRAATDRGGAVYIAGRCTQPAGRRLQSAAR